MASSLRSQLEALETKIAELQEMVTGEADDMTPIDLELDDIQVVEPVQEVEAESADEVAEEPAMEEVVDEVDDDLPFGDIDEPVDETVVLEVAEEPEMVEDPELIEEPVLKTVEEPSVAPVALVDSVSVHAVIDSMTDKQAWRTDMPGSPVRDIRSAISLNDRILFINNLFGQDPMAFQECLTRINQLETLDEAVEYVAQTHPHWDFESEVVYRFMMAVRRKVK